MPFRRLGRGWGRTVQTYLLSPSSAADLERILRHAIAGGYPEAVEGRAPPLVKLPREVAPPRGCFGSPGPLPPPPGGEPPVDRP